MNTPAPTVHAGKRAARKTQGSALFCAARTPRDEKPAPPYAWFQKSATRWIRDPENRGRFKCWKSAQAVYLFLAEQASNRGGAATFDCGSHALRNGVGMHRDTVRRILNELHDAALVTVERRKLGAAHNLPNRITLLASENGEASGPSGAGFKVGHNSETNSAHPPKADLHGGPPYASTDAHPRHPRRATPTPPRRPHQKKSPSVRKRGEKEKGLEGSRPHKPTPPSDPAFKGGSAAGGQGGAALEKRERTPEELLLIEELRKLTRMK